MGARRAQGVAAAVDEIDCGIGLIARHPDAVDPLTDDTAAVGRPGIDRNDVHDAGHDLAGQPQSPCPLGWKHGADLPKGQAADCCSTAGT